MELFETSKAICQMVQNGLLERTTEKGIEKKPKVKRTVNGNFFPIIENELRKIMGPMAPLLLMTKSRNLVSPKKLFLRTSCHLLYKR